MGAFRNLTQRCFIAALLANTALVALPVAAKAQSADKWGAHLDLEGKAGTDRNLGEGDLFLPLAQTDTTLVFGDMRMRFDDQESQEANIGLGVRHMLPSGWNLGAYGYFDRRGTENDTKFSQATLGLEALSTDWDFRVNGYIPLGDDSRTLGTVAPSSTAELSGTTIEVITTPGSFLEERSLGGFDAEVGWRLPIFQASDDEQLRFYVGGYRFAADGVEDVAGPRARLDFTMAKVPFLWEGSRLTLGAEVQHDDPRGTQAFASVRLRIPLYGGESASRLTPQEQRMTDTVVRDIDIVSQTRSVTTGTRSVETATATAGGQAITVLDSASTTGSQMVADVAAAGANSTVILSGTFATTATTQLQAGQTLMGAGSLTVRSASGKTASLAMPGGSIVNSQLGNTAAVSMANDSTITGMSVVHTDPAAMFSNPRGIIADGVQNVTIANNIVRVDSSTVATAFGIQVINAVTNANVIGNTVTTVGAANAVGIQVVSSEARVANNVVSATGADPSQSYAISLINGSTDPQIMSGSTGNVRVNGGCSTGGLVGTVDPVSFTDGFTCP
ncbi:MAG TPA: inverse autotransporter beta domain-containing protein [Alphaproteobacteria bacterium]|jgi:hypothetical protein